MVGEVVKVRKHKTVGYGSLGTNTFIRSLNIIMNYSNVLNITVIGTILLEIYTITNDQVNG